MAYREIFDANIHKWLTESTVNGWTGFQLVQRLKVFEAKYLEDRFFWKGRREEVFNRYLKKKFRPEGRK